MIPDDTENSKKLEKPHRGTETILGQAPCGEARQEMIQCVLRGPQPSQTSLVERLARPYEREQSRPRRGIDWLGSVRPRVRRTPLASILAQKMRSDVRKDRGFLEAAIHRV